MTDMNDPSGTAAPRLVKALKSVSSPSAPMIPAPDLVKAIPMRPGQVGEGGDVLCVIEAMKMEMMARTEREATIKEIFVAEGASLSADAPIMTFV